MRQLNTDRVISMSDFNRSKKKDGVKIYSRRPFDGKPELAEEFLDTLRVLKQIGAEGGYNDIRINLQ